MHKFKKAFIGAMSALGLFAASGTAHAVPVNLELALVIDVSGSVSTGEYDLQMDGYRDAFNDSGVQAFIDAGNAVAVSVIMFGTNASKVIDWTLLDSAAAATNFATLLDSFARPFGGGTDIEDGVQLAVNELLADNGYEGSRFIIDVSGDGTQNEPGNPNTPRNQAEANGITINGLAITNDVPTLDTYYANEVITSDGFVVDATFQTFSQAAIRKIGREVTGDPLPEPSALVIIGLGLLGLGAYSRRRKAA